MNPHQATCCICLEIKENSPKITEIDENNKSVIHKLRSCVPEIEWKDDYNICVACSVDLNQVYQFREKCHQSETQRRQKINTPDFKIETPDSKIEETSIIKIKNGDQNFTCHICNLTLTTSSELKSHSLQEHQLSVKPFECRLCDSKFAFSSNLAQHLKYHSGNRSFVCVFCGKGFVTKSDLKIHEKIHLNKREYKCDGCQKSFNTHKDLRTHKLVVHTDPNLWHYSCQICSKKFPIKSNYDAHMRRHKQERPFACHLCEKKFIDKCSLQKHFRSHSNIRSFSCEVCKREYKDKHVMDVHRARVHGLGDVKVPVKEKKHFCHICPKAYFEKNKLTCHLRKHAGEKPHSCKLCQKSFLDKSYLTRHLKKVHHLLDENPI